MDVEHQVGQVRVGDVTVGGRTRASLPAVVARAGHCEQPAGHRDVVPAGRQLGDQRADHWFGSTFSRAK